jgi:hypothetical protein
MNTTSVNVSLYVKDGLISLPPPPTSLPSNIHKTDANMTSMYMTLYNIRHTIVHTNTHPFLSPYTPPLHTYTVPTFMTSRQREPAVPRVKCCLPSNDIDALPGAVV